MKQNRLLFGINFRFVSYRGCILSEEMVRSGTMEKIMSFKARPGDVFVASFPKSGTTWVQEVVYQLYLNQCSKEVRLLKDPTDKKDKLESIDCKEILCQVSKRKALIRKGSVKQTKTYSAR